MSGGASAPADGSPQREVAGLRRAAAIVLVGALALLGLFLLLVTPPWQIPGGPAFFEDEVRRGLRDNMRIALWWMALVNAGLVSLLLATLRLWLRPVPTPSRARTRTSRLIVALVLLACALGFGLRVPLASKSLWWDEGWTVRRVVVGGYDVRAGGSEPGAFEPAEWRHTFFNYRKPTNHVLYSVAAAATTRSWQAVTGSPPHLFSDLAYRAPALLAAVATVGFVALLLIRAGAPHAAAIAALLLAVHPWHVRYGIDGRAYSFVMAGTAASLWLLLRFLQTSRMRDVLGYGACQIWLVWTYPYAAFVTAGTCVAGFAAIALDARRPPADRWARATRFFVAHLLAVMVVLQVLAPNLTQIREWEYGQHFVSVARLAATWSGLATGVPLATAPLAEGFGHPSVAESLPLTLWLWLGMPVMVGLGVWHGWRRGGALRATTLALLLSLGVAIAVNAALAQQFYPRFLIFALPGVVAAAGCGIAASGHAFARRTRLAPGTGAAIVGGIALLAFVAAVSPQLAMLLERPYSPVRDTAEFVASRPEPDAIVAGFGLGGWMGSLYAPRIRSIQTTAQLSALCQEARRDRRPLYVSLRYRPENLRRAPLAVAWLESGALERVERFAGIEPRFHTEVYRYESGDCPTAPAPEAATR